LKNRLITIFQRIVG